MSGNKLLVGGYRNLSNINFGIARLVSWLPLMLGGQVQIPVGDMTSVTPMREGTDYQL